MWHLLIPIQNYFNLYLSKCLVVIWRWPASYLNTTRALHPFAVLSNTSRGGWFQRRWPSVQKSWNISWGPLRIRNQQSRTKCKTERTQRQRCRNRMKMMLTSQRNEWIKMVTWKEELTSYIVGKRDFLLSYCVIAVFWLKPLLIAIIASHHCLYPQQLSVKHLLTHMHFVLSIQWHCTLRTPNEEREMIPFCPLAVIHVSYVYENGS